MTMTTNHKYTFYAVTVPPGDDTNQIIIACTNNLTLITNCHIRCDSEE